MVLVRRRRRPVWMAGNVATLGRDGVPCDPCFRCLRDGSEDLVGNVMERQTGLLLDREQFPDHVAGLRVQQSHGDVY